MQKIVKGKFYDTDTAMLIETVQYGDGFFEFQYSSEELYRKKNGEFFLCGEGVALSKYGNQVSFNEWGPGEVIIPLSYDEAREWVEEYCSVYTYCNLFGESEE